MKFITRCQNLVGDDPCDNFDHVSKCKHHIHSESCINFLSFKESNNNLKIARTSLTISKFAIGIALLGVFLPMFYDKCYTTKELQSLQQIQESISKTLPTLKTMRDSFSKQLILIQKDVHNANLLENNPYKVFSLKLKTDLKTDNKNLKTVESLNK